jgi:integrase
MSVRKRTWVSRDGVQHEAWLVDYVDLAGNRRARQFTRKKEADAFAQQVGAELLTGVHVADSASITVAEAAGLWLESARQRGLEPCTLVNYEEHTRLHIIPYIGSIKLTALTVAAVRAFEDRLHQEGRSTDMARRILISLGGILGDALDRGLVGKNVVRDRSRARKGHDRQQRHRRRLEIGRDIPTQEEIRKILAAATGQAHALLATAALCGLRSSELGGLRWVDVDLGKGEVHVRQRADRLRQIGSPKSAAARRKVPIPDSLALILKAWKLACPSGELVFPTKHGAITSHSSLLKRYWWPAQKAAGVIISTGRDAEGHPVMAPKYTGLHALRHFFASWCSAAKADGGLGLTIKATQELLGHTMIALTMDRYAHLFPDSEDRAAERNAAADRLLR